jgi:hypothetical protein
MNNSTFSLSVFYIIVFYFILYEIGEEVANERWALPAMEFILLHRAINQAGPLLYSIRNVLSIDEKCLLKIRCLILSLDQS